MLEATNRWDVRSKQERVLAQCRLHEHLSAAVVGVNVIPLDHPHRMFYLDRMVIQITQDVECLRASTDANNLMSRRLAGRGNDLDVIAQIMIPLDQMKQPVALYDSDVVYTPPDQADGRKPLSRAWLKKFLRMLREQEVDAETALMIVRMLKGIEIFLDIKSLYRRGKGDCNELVPVRVAELWRAGIAASPYLLKEPNDRGGWTYHAVVLWPDGSAEDPSLILGMGGPENAERRREEIRKNAERWGNYMAAAQRLVAVEGASPTAVGRKIELLGLAPRDGVFRSPYTRLLRAA